MVPVGEDHCEEAINEQTYSWEVVIFDKPLILGISGINDTKVVFLHGKVGLSDNLYLQ
jgi:hypothetical protein